MIQSLDDAWKWYDTIRKVALILKKLAEIWDNPAVLEARSRHNRLSDPTPTDLHQMAKIILEDLDDLSILVLFSVFEATVRAQAGADVDRHAALISHPALLEAVKELKEAIENGSFAKVTAAFKRMDTDFTAQVNQVRKYRNWVAHGRRDAPEKEKLANVTPDGAFDRLGRYLVLLASSSTDETPQPPAPERPPEA